MLNKTANHIENVLHNRLHGSRYTQTASRAFMPPVKRYAIENTLGANRLADYEPEGREFDSLRARHFFNRFNLISRAPGVLPTPQKRLWSFLWLRKSSRINTPDSESGGQCFKSACPTSSRRDVHRIYTFVYSPVRDFVDRKSPCCRCPQSDALLRTHQNRGAVQAMVERHNRLTAIARVVGRHARNTKYEPVPYEQKLDKER
jgi:hypothetical protein